jgi:hypothetical protein
MSECPSCGTRGAYIGFSSVDCINKECKFYSSKHAALYAWEHCDDSSSKPDSESSGGLYNPFRLIDGSDGLDYVGDNPSSP